MRTDDRGEAGVDSGFVGVSVRFWMLLIALYSPEASAIVAVFAEDARAAPGEPATVVLDLTTHDDVSDFSITVHYDPLTLSVAGVDTGELTEAWGAEGLTWVDDPVVGELALTGTAHGLDPIRFTSGDLLEVFFEVASEATIGSVSAITLDPATFWDPSGAELLSFSENGEVTVIDPDAPPPPEPLSFALEVPDVTAAPGEAFFVDIRLDHPAPVVVLAFDLWVDPLAMTVDAERSAELAERAAHATLTSTVLTESGQQYALGTGAEGPWIESGEGWIVRLPYSLSETAAPGFRSMMVGSTDAFAMVDSAMVRVEVTAVSGLLTIVSPEAPDTGEPADTGSTPDTGGSSDTGETTDTGVTVDTGPSPDTDEADDTGDGHGDGGDESGPNDEVDTGMFDERKVGCGCASTPGLGVLWLGFLMVFPLVRRRAAWQSRFRVAS